MVRRIKSHVTVGYSGRGCERSAKNRHKKKGISLKKSVKKIFDECALVVIYSNVFFDFISIIIIFITIIIIIIILGFPTVRIAPGRT